MTEGPAPFRSSNDKPGARGIALGGLHLDYPCTEVAEHLGQHVAREEAGEVADAHAVELRTAMNLGIDGKVALMVSGRSGLGGTIAGI